MLFYVSLIVLGVVATILGIVSIVRLSEIHRLVNSNFTAQRAEIAALHLQLATALKNAGILEQQRNQLRDASEGGPA